MGVADEPGYNILGSVHGQLSRVGVAGQRAAPGIEPVAFGRNRCQGHHLITGVVLLIGGPLDGAVAVDGDVKLAGIILRRNWAGDVEEIINLGGMGRI